MSASASEYEYLFGPVPSRRFGRSLGVDLVPFKTCSQDCIFCQLGRGGVPTTERREYVPVTAVREELGRWFAEGGESDYVTLSGSGEPTLHTRFGEVIDFAHEKSDTPVALLTNSTTLHLPEVRSAAARADVVKASLSAWDEESFRHINRPCAGVDFEGVVDGLRALRDELSGGMLWIEVFVLWGLNSVPADVEKIAELVRSVRPDRVHLNTAVRPTAESFATALPRDAMDRLAELFDPLAEVIGEAAAEASACLGPDENAVMAMLRRRPCTTAEMAEVFGMDIEEMTRIADKLAGEGKIRVEYRDDRAYCVAVSGG